MFNLSELQTLDPFWLRYTADESGCWLWTGCRTDKGYGKLGAGRAHRLAYEKAVGPIPHGLNILHSCDVRACGNPAHLEPGTQKQNLADMRCRGRGTQPPHARGCSNPSAKLSQEQAAEVKRSTGKLKDIAERYGIAVSTVWAIRNDVHWRHLSV